MLQLTQINFFRSRITSACFLAPRMKSKENKNLYNLINEELSADDTDAERNVLGTLLKTAHPFPASSKNLFLTGRTSFFLLPLTQKGPGQNKREVVLFFAFRTLPRR